MINLNYRAFPRDYRELRFKNTIIPLPYTVAPQIIGTARALRARYRAMSPKEKAACRSRQRRDCHVFLTSPPHPC